MPLDEPKLGGPRLYEGNDKEYTMQGLKRILISIILGLSPLLGDMTAAENEPTTGGIEQGTTSVAQQASLDSKPVVRTSFEYVKIPDPEQEDGRTLAKKAFEAFINDNRNAVLVSFRVSFWVKLSIKTKRILKPTTTTSGNADAKDCAILEFLICNDFLDFAGCLFSKRNRHCKSLRRSLRIVSRTATATTSGDHQMNSIIR